MLTIILLLVAYIDMKKMIIPNSLTAFLLLYAIYTKGSNILDIENGILGMGAYALPFVFTYGYLSDLLQKEVLGFGDVKLVLAFGYILGYSNLIDIYDFFILSFILASVFGIIIGLYRKNLHFHLPFSPFLIITFIYFKFFR